MYKSIYIYIYININIKLFFLIIFFHNNLTILIDKIIVIF